MKANNDNDKDDSNDSNVAPVVSRGGSADKGWTTVYLSVVLPLLLVYVSNQWSRSSLYYLVNFASDNNNEAAAFNAMNIDLDFSKAQYGALASVAFTALFAVASLLAGNLSDKVDRKFLTVASAVAWSLLTLATASATSFSQVLLLRILLGLACAFSTPAAYTLLRDNVAPSGVALANSVYGGGIYLGGALSSLTILLRNSLGWRGALQAIGALGMAAVLVAAVVLPADSKDAGGKTVPAAAPVNDDDNDKSNQKEKAADATATNVVSDALTVLSSPTVRWLFAGALFRFSAGLSIGIWAAPYFQQAFPDDSTAYALVNACIVGICGVLSGLLGGGLADRLSNAAASTGTLGGRPSSPNQARLAIPVVGTLLAIPTWWLTVHATTFSSAMTWLAVEYLVAECFFGPTVAVLQSSVPSRLGGTAQGMFTLTGALGNVAPSILGVLYGQATANGGGAGAVDGVSVLSHLLGVGVSTAYFLSAVCFFFCARSIAPNDQKKAT